MYVNARVCTEIMHWWLRRDLARHSGEVAIDLGAGAMRNRPLLRARRYVAVELDRERLNDGERRYPDAEAHVAPIQEFRFPGGADLVICIQVLLNRHFQAEESVQAVSNAVALTRPGGCLALTIGAKNAPYEEAIDGILAESFETVKKKPFGRLDFMSPLSLPIGFVGSALPVNWEPRDRNRRRVYYFCSGRRPEL